MEEILVARGNGEIELLDGEYERCNSQFAIHLVN